VFVFVGIANALAMAGSLLVSPFARRLIKWSGEINMICFAIVFVALKLLLFAIVM